MTLEPGAQGGGLCINSKAGAQDPEAGLAPGGRKASPAHRLRSSKHTDSWLCPSLPWRVGDSAFWNELWDLDQGIYTTVKKKNKELDVINKKQ